ncbi:MAG: DUF1566 domain-containing protein [Spirochaeta sp.]
MLKCVILRFPVWVVCLAMMLTVSLSVVRIAAAQKEDDWPAAAEAVVRSEAAAETGPAGGVVVADNLEAAPAGWDGGDTDPVLAWEDAAAAVQELKYGGADDWVLPSKKQLDLLFQHREEIGGFSAPRYYWSRTGSGDQYWIQDFFSGYQDLGRPDDRYAVRPVRIF